jgi:hypothetical protein
MVRTPPTARKENPDMKRKASIPVLAALAAVIFLTDCIGRRPPNDDIPSRPPSANFPDLPQGPALQVLVLGDWGTGEEGQKEVADAMAEAHANSPPDFVITVGDNFYPEGVERHHDPLWESHFESVYRGPFWDGLVFYPTLGNHDHYGRPEAQIRYSELSPKWEMDNRYYALERGLPGGGAVLFLAMDTNPFAKGDRESSLQWTWADSLLRTSSADWKVAYGHHPFATGGWHSPDDRVREALLPLFDGRAELYLAGHNHTTELIETEVTTLQAVCGGGGGLDNPYRVDTIPGTIAAFTNGGWCFLRLWPRALAVDLYDREGGLQFRHLIRR